jgi:hypothetical protein
MRREGEERKKEGKKEGRKGVALDFSTLKSDTFQKHKFQLIHKNTKQI